MTDTESALNELLVRRRSCRRFEERPLSLDTLDRLLSSAQGVTSIDGKRATPSAHAFYPLQLFVVARQIEGVGAGIYETSSGRLAASNRLAATRPGSLLSAALADDVWLEQAPAVIVIAADREAAIDHFADQPPDGRRGARYVDFEVGAATQNLYLSTTAQGLGGVIVMGFDDDAMRTALGLSEDLAPIALFCVGYPNEED